MKVTISVNGVEASHEVEDRMLLVHYPKSSHTDEGNAALAQATPKIAELQKDENDWQATGSAACVPGASAQACDGIAIYQLKHAAGLHAAEAQRKLDARGAK